MISSAAIFDLDGTLIDSGRLHYKAFRKVVDDWWGMDFDYEKDFAPHYGKSAVEIITPFLEKNNIDVEKAGDFANQRRDTLKSILEDGVEIKLLDGAKEAVDTMIDEGFKTGLATGNRRETGELMVELAGFKDKFTARVYGDDVEKGKPDPAIFLKAAETLGVTPDKCIVFEDSVHGVEAAKNAGMKVVAVATGMHSFQELEGLNPDVLLNDLTGLDVKKLE